MSAGNKNSLVHDNAVLRGKNNGKTTQSLVVWAKPYQLDGSETSFSFPSAVSTTWGL